VIVTKEGDAMKVYGVEISGTSVFFREQEAEDSPIRKMKKEDLLMVKYRDGKKVIMDDSERPRTKPLQVQYRHSPKATYR